MNITIFYQPNALELAKASSLFIEKKPLLYFMIGFLNIATALFLLIFIIKLVVMGLTLQESIAALVFGLWLFGRKPFHQWLLYLRMKASPVIHHPIKIEISRNGIVWSGKGLRSGNIRWEEIKMLIEVQNGFLLPNTFIKFLWLPFRGFQAPAQLQDFRTLIKEKQILIKLYNNVAC